MTIGDPVEVVARAALRTRPLELGRLDGVIVRLLVGGRIVLGVLLLFAPDSVLRPLAKRRLETGERTVARLLGLRNVVEGGFLARRHSRGLLVAGAAVDGTHALSMVVLAIARREHRRLATTSALSAASTAATSLVAAAAIRHHPEWREL